MHPIITAIREDLRKAANPQKAREMQAYMKTDQPFYGVPARERRHIFRAAVKKHPINSRQQYEQVILELWQGTHREEMYQALEVAERYKSYRDAASLLLYERLIETSPNWDTLDWIAGKLVSQLVLSNRRLEDRLIEWSESPNLWVRRAALLAHLRHREQTNTALLSDTILKLAHEKDFFIRKAIGWVLRDYSYANPQWVKRFVENYADRLSALIRREALKRINRQKTSSRGTR